MERADQRLIPSDVPNLVSIFGLSSQKCSEKAVKSRQLTTLANSGVGCKKEDTHDGEYADCSGNPNPRIWI